MKKRYKMRERETRAQCFGMAVLAGVTFRWDLRGSGVTPFGVRAPARKVWYFTLPNWHKGGYISGPFETKWEAVEAALRNLGVGTDAGISF